MPRSRQDFIPTEGLVPLLNANPVPPGTHRDALHPIAVMATLRWQTGTEEIATEAREWTGDLVRVLVADTRVLTGAVWLPAADVRRR